MANPATLNKGGLRKKPMAKKAKFHWVTADMADLTEEVCGYGFVN